MPIFRSNAHPWVLTSNKHDVNIVGPKVLENFLLKRLEFIACMILRFKKNDIFYLALSSQLMVLIAPTMFTRTVSMPIKNERGK